MIRTIKEFKKAILRIQKLFKIKTESINVMNTWASIKLYAPSLLEKIMGKWKKIENIRIAFLYQIKSVENLTCWKTRC